jgi:uncharacterized protein with HEPN domain
MPKRDPDLLVEDILEALEKIRRYTADMGQEEFQQDAKTIDAVVRNLEIVGEATRQLPEEFIARHPDVPWRQIAGLRNRIVEPDWDWIGTGLSVELLAGLVQTAASRRTESREIEEQSAYHQWFTLEADWHRIGTVSR